MAVHLVKHTVSRETVEALEGLLAMAKTGEITGIVYAGALRRSRYMTDVTGRCYSHPTLTLGMLGVLSDKLIGMVKA